jgi:septal ring factor EnvC (AmiA/AmiB activator)
MAPIGSAHLLDSSHANRLIERVPTPARPKDDADDALEALLGRTSAQLDEARAELALAETVRARLAAEVERLEHRLRESEAERLELADKIAHRDRIITQVFSSRSWRWTQALRRLLRR